MGHVNQIVAAIDCKVAPLADLAEILDRSETVDRPEGAHISDLLTLAKGAPAAAVIYPIPYLSCGKHDLIVHRDPLQRIFLFD